jgi:Stigma-specific protein, Stig1
MKHLSSIVVTMVVSGSLACARTAPLTPGRTEMGMDASTSGATDTASIPSADAGPDTIDACRALMPTLCGAGCADMTLDPDNCGSCGHACAAAEACVEGRCRGPVNLVPASSGCTAINLAVGGGILYWTDQGNGSVKSQPVAGGPVTTISSIEANPGLVVVNASNLFWIDVVTETPGVAPDGSAFTTTAIIRRATLPGGTPSTVATETNLIGGLVVSEDGETLYYSAGADVKAVPVVGGAAVVVGQEVSDAFPAALAIHGNTLGFPTAFGGEVDVIVVMPGEVARCGGQDPASGDLVEVNCTRVDRDQGALLLTSIFFEGDNIYWSAGPGGNFILVNSALPTASIGDQLVASAMGMDGSAVITAMAGASTFIYFGEDGLVERTPYAVGSKAVAIARGQKSPHSIAVDATRVYWSTDDCAINSETQ